MTASRGNCGQDHLHRRPQARFPAYIYVLGRYGGRERHHIRHGGRHTEHARPRSRAHRPRRGQCPGRLCGVVPGPRPGVVQGGHLQSGRYPSGVEAHGGLAVERRARHHPGRRFRIRPRGRPAVGHRQREALRRGFREGGRGHRQVRRQEDQGRRRPDDPLQQQRGHRRDRRGHPPGEGRQGVRDGIPPVEAGDPDRPRPEERRGGGCHPHHRQRGQDRDAEGRPRLRRRGYRHLVRDADQQDRHVPGGDGGRRGEGGVQRVRRDLQVLAQDSLRRRCDHRGEGHRGDRPPGGDPRGSEGLQPGVRHHPCEVH